MLHNDFHQPFKIYNLYKRCFCAFLCPWNISLRMSFPQFVSVCVFHSPLAFMGVAQPAAGGFCGERCEQISVMFQLC